MRPGVLHVRPRTGPEGGVTLLLHTDGDSDWVAMTVSAEELQRRPPSPEATLLGAVSLLERLSGIEL